jgi:hypothetical protein
MAIMCPNIKKNNERCNSEYIIRLGKDNYICNDCKLPVYVWPAGTTN